MTASVVLPDRPPFAIRARVLTPLAAGGTRDEADGRSRSAPPGRIAASGRGRPPSAGRRCRATAIDLRPLVVLPGLVDLHAHLPQLPNAGLGAGLDLLTWLERYIFPLERGFDEARPPSGSPRSPSARSPPPAPRPPSLYGAVYEPSLDAAFRAAEAHGIRASSAR